MEPGKEARFRDVAIGKEFIRNGIIYRKTTEDLAVEIDLEGRFWPHDKVIIQSNENGDTFV